MTDQPPSQFKFRFDADKPDEPDEPALHEEGKDRRIEKLGRRITRLSILLPLLLIVSLAYAYLDLKGRVATFQDNGVSEVQALGKDVEARFAALSDKQAALEAAVDKMSDDFQKSAETLNRQVAALQEGADDRAGKWVDRLEQGFAAAEKAREAIRSEAKAAKAAIDGVKAAQTANTRELAALSEEIDKEITQINGSLSDLYDLVAEYNRSVEKVAAKTTAIEERLADIGQKAEKNSAEKVGIETFEQKLEEEKAIYRQMQSLITKNLEAKIEALRKEIRQRTEAPSKSRTPAAAPSPPAAAPDRPPVPKPPPGKILEQNLQ